MRKLYVICGITILAALLAGSLTLFVPAPADGANPYFHSTFLAATLMSTVYLGATIVLLLGLKGFTPRFKRAYILLCAGLTLIALGYLHIPLLALFSLMKSPWVAYGGIGLPFVAAILLVYFGMRGFAKLYEIKNVLTSAWFMGVSAIAFGALSTFLPHGQTTKPEAEVAGLLAVQVTILTVTTWTTLLSYQVMKRAGGIYKAALSAIFWYLALGLLVSISILVSMFIQPSGNAYVESSSFLHLYLLCGLFLMKAGIAFNRISRGETDTSSPVSRPASQETPTDVVVYAANLASNTEAIDPILDTMRTITARLSPGQELSPHDQEVLAKVYLQIEEYLTLKDPIRHIDRLVLRAQVARQFAPVASTSPIFWQQITAQAAVQ